MLCSKWAFLTVFHWTTRKSEYICVRGVRSYVHLKITFRIGKIGYNNKHFPTIDVWLWRVRSVFKLTHGILCVCVLISFLLIVFWTEIDHLFVALHAEYTLNSVRSFGGDSGVRANVLNVFGYYIVSANIYFHQTYAIDADDAMNHSHYEWLKSWIQYVRINVYIIYSTTVNVSNKKCTCRLFAKQWVSTELQQHNQQIEFQKLYLL